MTATTKGPKSLVELVGVDLAGFSICVGYALELDHGLMGYFPAIIKPKKAQEKGEVILTVDLDLLKQIWKMLSPRRSKINEATVLCSQRLGIAYPLAPTNSSHLDEGLARLKMSLAMPLVTQTRFAKLTSGGKNPFGWAPGLVGDDMTAEEFLETIEAARSEQAA